MKRKFFVGLTLALLLGCRDRAEDNSESLKKILGEYFDGIGTGNREKMKSVTTDDFLIYEDGQIMNNDSVFKEMDRLGSYRANFGFKNFKVKVDHNLGHISYYEHATFVVDDTVKLNLHFTGSAAFVKDRDHWKMYFMHATSIDSTKLIQ